MKKIFFILNGYFLFMWYYLYKPYRDKIKKESLRRMNICKNCEHFNDILYTCNLCGCFMEVKSKMVFKLDENIISIDGCLDKRW